ncbi:MAG TPA: hypothetical protein VLT62_11730 [Candidatus Methylomirabilis sp.]|nr:hypothetical protein [Candidatus Methylomirabilis sp.]
MSPQPPGAFKYDLQSITKNAPPASGVYTLFSPSKCLYVGESGDICASLLETFFEDNPSLNDQHPTHFIFELIPPESRVARQADRIRELGPVCNARVGSPEGGHVRGPQGHDGVTAIPAAARHDRETASPSSRHTEIDSPKDPDFSTVGQERPVLPGPAGQTSRVDGGPAGGGEKVSALSSAQPITAPRPEIPAALEAKDLRVLGEEPGRRETDVNGVANEHLSASAPVDLAEAGDRSDQGPIAQIPATPEADTGETERAVAKAAGAWAHWKLAAISGLLVVIAGASLWVLFSRGVPEIARGLLPPQIPAEVQVPSIAGKSEREAVETVSPPPQGGTPGETSARESTPPEPPELALPPETSRTPTPEPKKDRAKNRQGPAARARSQSGAPAVKAESQGPAEMDPTAIIDWLLKRPSAGKE